MQELYIAVVCASNMNRSMEAHAYLEKKGFKVKSFGTADKVRLPGLTLETPNVFDFGTPYTQIHQELVNKNREFYTQNGILNMLDRNRRIKACPERFQDSTEMFDVILTCHESVLDQVIKMFAWKENLTHKDVQVINVNIEDNPEEATIGAFLLCDLVSKLTQSKDLAKDIDEILYFFEIKSKKTMMNCTLSY